MKTIHTLSSIGVILVAINMVTFAEPARSVVIDDEQAHTITHGGCIKRIYPITCIEQEEIDKQHLLLVQEFKLNTLERYGVKAATAAVFLYLAYEVWRSHIQSREVNHQISGISLASVPSREVNGEEFDQLKKSFHAHVQENYPQWLSLQWFKNSAKSIGWSVINIALAKSVFERGEQIIDGIMHEGNLEWFVRTHTHSLETLVEVSEYAHSHDTPGSSVREHAHHKEQIMHVTQSFMQQMTAILGFMSYSKSITANPDVRMQMHTLMDYFRVTCDEYAQNVSNALEHDTAVMPHINKISAELNRLLKSFMRLEREQGAR